MQRELELVGAGDDEQRVALQEVEVGVNDFLEHGVAGGGEVQLRGDHPLALRRCPGVVAAEVPDQQIERQRGRGRAAVDALRLVEVLGRLRAAEAGADGRREGSPGRGARERRVGGKRTERQPLVLHRQLRPRDLGTVGEREVDESGETAPRERDAPGGGLFSAGGRLRGALGTASRNDGGAAGGDKRGKRDYRGLKPHYLALARPSRIWMPATGMRPSGSGPMLSM